jgi:hypothetical protein
MENNTNSTINLDHSDFFRKNKFLIIFLTCLLLLIALSGVVLAMMVTSGKKDGKSVNITSTTTVATTLKNMEEITNISSTVQSTATNIAKPNPYAGWTNYYYEPLDITIKYPNDYYIEQNATTYKTCTEIPKEFLKDPTTCKNQTIWPKIAMYKKGSGTSMNYINIFGPATVGGVCDEKAITKIYQLTIIDKTYSYELKKEPNGDFCSRETSLHNVTATGEKSIWSQYSIKVDAENETELQKSILILESIKRGVVQNN